MIVLTATGFFVAALMLNAVRARIRQRPAIAAGVA
jgi:hypothetical protein